MRTRERWEISVDTGGTFTDCVATSPSGRICRAKVFSHGALRGRVLSAARTASPAKIRLLVEYLGSAPPKGFDRVFSLRPLDSMIATVPFEAPDDRSAILIDGAYAEALAPGRFFELLTPEPAAVLGARIVTASAAEAPLPRLDFRFATTRGTNALLERRGARVALFITKGFGDLLLIGDQSRPDLFAAKIEIPEPLFERSYEIDVRVGADGDLLADWDEEEVLGAARDALDRGIRHAAVSCIHGYLRPEIEMALADELLRLGFDHVSSGAELARRIKILPRTETAVVNAYLAEPLEDLLSEVARPLHEARLRLMTSAGGLVGRDVFRPKDSLLSGPAGGVVGALAAARRTGHSKAIAFDMGGTSTDVSRIDDDLDYVFEHRVGPAHLYAPAVDIISVAAGGGSVCSMRDGRLLVGPDSAGAIPGPACYGAGGPLTITDVNLLLGRLAPLRKGIPLDPAPARVALESISSLIEREEGRAPDETSLLHGFLDVANETMADAIRQVSIRRGYDVADYALVAFGGAGPQHACAVADHLGLDTVIIPLDAGLLSAHGLAAAVIERVAERQVLAPLADVDLDALRREVEAEAVGGLLDEKIERDRIRIRRGIVHLRLKGQDSTLEIAWGDTEQIVRDFVARYDKIFGLRARRGSIEVESVEVIAASVPDHFDDFDSDRASEDVHSAAVAGKDAAVVPRHCLSSKDAVEGPALIIEAHTVTVVDEGWTARSSPFGDLLMVRSARLERHEAREPIAAAKAELFTHRFSTIARDMGETLRRTSTSTNVKERLDFSCAILDEHGRLVVNAPHVPVHLGSMGLCVRSVRERIDLQPGDVAITNHPAHGGSHLPDITVITAVGAEDGKILGYVAGRAHHAEIGGIAPGSMPSDARHLVEEGVVIAPRFLIRDGKADWDGLEELLLNAPYPSRAVDRNLADIRAALAANHRGAKRLAALAAEYGEREISAQMKALSDRAARCAERALARLSRGRHRAVEYLDDGTRIAVTIDVRDGVARISFEGSSEVHPGNLNATPAIVHGAVVYALRLLLDEEIPLNEGMMTHVEVHIPPGLLSPGFTDDPRSCPAVCGGNVETSQRIVDTLLKAVRLCACSQGTMNNLLLGNERISYYETVGGGAGAGPGYDGASGVHTHMTNTRITDPEILEHRYPVRLLRFSLRRGSGGRGAFRGGDGLIRRMLFLDDLRVSLLTQHRKQGPYGLGGGENGAAGKNILERCDGERVLLEGICGFDVGAGDILEIRTPGGGGFGFISSPQTQEDRKNDENSGFEDA